MMIPMPITLTCTCGQKRVLAGRASDGRNTVACSACGKALAIPAMGVLATAKTKPAPKRTEAAQPRRVGLLLIAAGVLLMLGTAIGWLSWSMTRAQPVEAVPI